MAINNWFTSLVKLNHWYLGEGGRISNNCSENKQTWHIWSINWPHRNRRYTSKWCQLHPTLLCIVSKTYRRLWTGLDDAYRITCWRINLGGHSSLLKCFFTLVNRAFSLLAPLRQSPSCRIWWKHVWVSQKIWAESADNYRNCFTLWGNAALEGHNPRVREDQTGFRLVAALLTLFSMHQFIFKIQLKVKMPIFRV